MRRFNYDNNNEEVDKFFLGDKMNYDEDFEDDEFDDDFDDDTASYIEVAQIDLANTAINQKLLAQAIHIAQSGFFWKFRKIETKLNKIKEIYNFLMGVLEHEEEK